MGFDFATSASAPAVSFGFGKTAVTAAPSADATTKSPAAPTAATGGFSFAQAPAPAGSGPAGFSFGAPASTDASKASNPVTAGLFGNTGAAVVAPPPSIGGGGTGGGGFGLGGAAAAAAPAAGGFSFGDAPNKAETNAPAPAAPTAGGFSFGGAAPSAASVSTKDAKDTAKDAAATATPAAKSGFSFGVGGAATPGTTPAAKVPSPVETPIAAVGGAPTATPGFASPPATSTGATPAASHTAQSSTAAQPQMIEPPPVEYQSLTIEQILNRFQSELETDAISFMQEAQRVAHYDATLRDTQHSLSDLTNMVSRLMLQQSEVDTQLQGIGSYQRELGGTLDMLERNVDELFAAQSHTDVGEADVAREQSYERALDVDTKLTQMNGVLTNVVHDLNAAQERVWSSSGSTADGSKNEEVGKIIGVFNAHHETLAFLESQARAVESDLGMIGQVLAKSGH